MAFYIVGLQKTLNQFKIVSYKHKYGCCMFYKNIYQTNSINKGHLFFGNAKLKAILISKPKLYSQVEKSFHIETCK